MNIGDNLQLSDIKLPEGLDIPALAQGPEHDSIVVSVIGKQITDVSEEEGEGEGTEA
jgi:large subunit ribosomal protein L25